MPRFVELWIYLSATPLFGLTATLVVYLLANAAYARLGSPPWANPVLWSVIALASGLIATGVDYPTYFAGAQFIHFLLGPAVVALAWPLWQRRIELRARFGRLMLAALLGGAAACASAVALGWAVGLPHDVVLSLAPKSVTAGVAMGISESLGADPSLSAAAVVLTGIMGAIIVTPLMNRTGVTDYRARGFAAGLAAHGIGTARAFQVDEIAGVFSGIAMSLNALVTSFLVPLAVTLLVR